MSEAKISDMSAFEEELADRTVVNGIDTVYEFERHKAPSINVIGYNPDGSQYFDAARTLTKFDVNRLPDVVKTLDASRG